MASGQTEPAPAGRLLRWLGLGLSIAGVVFVARVIAVRWDEVRGELGDVSVGWLVAALAAAALAMTAVAVRWRASIRVVGADLGPAEAVALYFRGEIAKYVPGGVWAIVGRAELARRRGMPWRTAYASVTLSLITLYAGAACTAAVFAPLVLGLGGWAWAGAAVAAGGGAAGLALVARRPALVARLGLPAPRQLALLVVGYLPAWALVGTATWCVARSLAGGPPFGRLVFAAAVSWLAGFLALPAPGGIGVREAVFVAVAGPLAGTVTATVAVLARLVFMVTDAVGAVVASGPWWARPANSGLGHYECPGQGPEHL